MSTNIDIKIDINKVNKNKMITPFEEGKITIAFNKLDDKTQNNVNDIMKEFIKFDAEISEFNKDKKIKVVDSLLGHLLNARAVALKLKFIRIQKELKQQKKEDELAPFLNLISQKLDKINKFVKSINVEKLSK